MTEIELGELCEVVAGGTPSRSRADYFGGSIPFVKIGDMLQDKVVRTEEHITEAGLQNSAAKLLMPGTILLSIFATVGRTAVLGIEAATNQAIVGLRPRKERVVDTAFLRRVLDHKASELIRQARGVAQVNVNTSILKALKVPLPTLEEQKRIAEVLDRADALRQKRRLALQKRDTLLQSVFIDMFGDPKANPKGWDILPTADILSTDRAGIRTGPFGSSLKKAEYTNLGIAVWGINNVLPNRFVEERPLYISGDKADQLRNYSVERGDILISRAGTVGRMCVATPSCDRSIIGTNLVRVSLNKSILSPIFFSTMFTYFGVRLGSLRSSSDEDAYSFLNPATLRTINIPVPPIDLQHRFERVLKVVEELAAKLGRHSGALDDLFLSLQSMVF